MTILSFSVFGVFFPLSLHGNILVGFLAYICTHTSTNLR